MSSKTDCDNCAGSGVLISFSYPKSCHVCGGIGSVGAESKNNIRMAKIGNDQSAIDEYPDILGPCIVRRVSKGRTLIMMNVESELIDDKHDEMWIARMQLPPSELRKKLPESSLKYTHDQLLCVKYDWSNLDKTFSGYDNEED